MNYFLVSQEGVDLERSYTCPFTLDHESGVLVDDIHIHGLIGEIQGRILDEINTNIEGVRRVIYEVPQSEPEPSPDPAIERARETVRVRARRARERLQAMAQTEAQAEAQAEAQECPVTTNGTITSGTTTGGVITAPSGETVAPPPNIDTEEQPMPDPIIVDWHNSYSYSSRPFRSIVDIVLPSIPQKQTKLIMGRIPERSERNKLLSGDCLNILVFGRAKSTTNNEDLTFVDWNGESQKWYKPSDYVSAHKIIINDSPVAEIYKENVYIYGPLWKVIGGADLFRQILDYYIYYINTTDKEKKESEAWYQKVHMERSKKLYTSLCSNRIDKQIATLARKIQTGHDDINNAKLTIVNTTRAVQDNLFSIDNLKSRKKNQDKVFEEEFDKLLAAPKVKSINVSDNTFTVYTENLYCFHPKKKTVHDIGEFKIKVSGEEARMYNLTRKVHGHDRNMNAPHVFPNGKPCLGSLESVLPELIANYEYSAVIMICIQFLESVNLEDCAGKFLYRWPKVPDDKADELNPNNAPKVEMKPKAKRTTKKTTKKTTVKARPKRKVKKRVVKKSTRRTTPVETSVPLTATIANDE